jgi:hypothetical protein
MVGEKELRPLSLPFSSPEFGGGGAVMGSEQDAAGDQRYAAMLLFQFRVVTATVSNKRRLCEKRLILLTAPNGRTALRAAKRRGREAQHSYLNEDGGRVWFEFVGVLDLVHLGVECEPDEVYYQLCRLTEPMERRATLLPPESRLQGRRRGPKARRAGRK